MKKLEDYKPYAEAEARVETLGRRAAEVQTELSKAEELVRNQSLHAAELADALAANPDAPIDDVEGRVAALRRQVAVLERATNQAIQTSLEAEREACSRFCAERKAAHKRKIDAILEAATNLCQAVETEREFIADLESKGVEIRAPMQKFYVFDPEEIHRQIDVMRQDLEVGGYN